MRIFAILLFALSALASDPVPAGRLPASGNWSNLCGVTWSSFGTSGIPNLTTISSTLGPSATDVQINSALSSCPSGQVVHVTAGTYTSIANQILMQKDGIVLRGDTDANGNPTTVFNVSTFQAIVMGSTGWDTSTGTGWNTVTVTAGATRGSTTVTLSSIPTGCSIGALLWLSTTNPIAAGGSYALFLNTDPFVMIVKVTNVAGNNVSFFPAINADYISTSTIHASTSKNTVYHRMGLENIILTANNFTYLQSNGTDECWMKNCVLSNSPSGAIRQLYLYTVNRFEVRHCDFGTIAAAGSDAYAIINQDCTGVWVENNYFHNSPNFYPQLGAQNCVFSYNFCTNVPYGNTPGWLSQIVYNHGCHNCYDLYEGNYVPQYYDDGLTDNSNDPTSTACTVRLRDRIVAWDGSDSGKIYNCNGLVIFDAGTNCVATGCQIGKVGFTTEYQFPGGGGSSDKCCYRYDSGTVGNSIGLYGNWNAFDQGVHASEVLSGGQVIVNSYLYQSTPNWFGNLAWPPFDPGSAPTDTKVSIPAQFRAANGGADPPASTVGSISAGAGVTIGNGVRSL